MAPVSPAVAKLLHQLQAQIIREADAARQFEAIAAPEWICLPATVKYTHSEHREGPNGHRVLVVRDAEGNQLRLQTPTCCDPNYRDLRPGIWYGSERRVDTNGEIWQSNTVRYFTTDDFGQLVPVGGAS